MQIENNRKMDKTSTKKNIGDKESKRVRKITLKDWDADDKPREKLINKGKRALSNAELLAILIRSGSVGENAVDLAKEILKDSQNNLTSLSRRDIKDLTQGYKGMGEAKAITIIAALELGYRMLGETNKQDDMAVTDSGKLFSCISTSLVNLPTEEFWAIYLNVKMKIIFKQKISSGGLTNVSVDTRRIFSIALEKNAVYIAVAHNHPTGSLKPSKNDIDLTKQIKECGKILNINLVDHIIIGTGADGRTDYYSFADNGMI